MKMNNLIFLNIGAGSKKIQGFINVDIEPGSDVMADVTKGLPFEDGSVDGIYSEHFIEHLSQAEGCFFFRECRRILRPGSIMRIATPDLDAIVDFFNKGGVNSSANVSDWLHSDWTTFGYEWISNRAEMLNTAVREWGHKWMYNEEEMIRLGEMCGLKFKTRCEFGESSNPWLKNLEYRDSSSLIIEFEKPYRKSFGGYPIVSVCIPAYKPVFFKEALDSVINQTYEHLEILISDDAPNADIEEIAKNYSFDKRIKFFKNPVHGGDENYINALSHATGDYIKFFNDDDILVPTCVETLVRAAEENPHATLITSTRKQFQTLGEFFPQSGPFMPILSESSEIDCQIVMSSILENRLNFIGEPNCTIFRREDILDIKPSLLTIGGQQGVMGTPGDVVMWLNLLSKGNMIYLVDCLSYLRVHPQQIQNSADYNSKGIAAWERMIQQAKRLGMHKKSVYIPEKIKSLNHPISTTIPVDLIAVLEALSANEISIATEALNNYIERKGQSSWTYALLGDIFLSIGKKSEADEILKEGKRLYPRSAELLQRI